MKRKVRSGALAFIVLMGIVSLFSDMTHEGARSILGEYLSLTGASAASIGFISGFGELCGYSLRLLSGMLADKTKKYWVITIIGYMIQVVAIPALALVPGHGFVIAGALVICERIGKALKKPAKNTLVSFAASEVGQGKGFAWQEFLDQLGAFIGPVILFWICAYRGGKDLIATYRICFLVLGIPAIITIGLLFLAKRKYPDPEQFEKTVEKEEAFHMKRPFLLYMIAICMFAFGFADFTLITMHAAKEALVPDTSLSLLYAAAMAVDAVAALFFGWLYDKKGLSALMISTLCAAPFSALIFLGNSVWSLFLGIFLWGIGMGAQESIMKAAVSSVVPKSSRSTGFGIFETGFGVAWFIGSWFMGAMYDRSPVYLVIFSTVTMVLAVPFYWLSSVKRRENFSCQKKQ